MKKEHINQESFLSELEQLIKKVLQNAYARRDSKVLEPLLELNQQISKVHEIIQTMLLACSKALKTAKSITSVEPKLELIKGVSAIGGTIFVFTFEGQYVNRINAIISLLITDGHDLFDPLRQRFVHTIEEIEPISIEIKFKFLKEHNLSGLVREKDQRIRNKIAHNKFTLCDDGKLIIDGKNIDIIKRINDLSDFTNKITDHITKCYNKFHSSIQVKNHE